MAFRRKSWTRRIVVVSILALAAFGGYVLYKEHNESAAEQYTKVETKVEAVKRALEE
jgi:predicted negative regulator of RcsB-dependent stress response